MNSHDLHLSHPKYRPDIDGLRAIAVLAVVAFHAFPSWVKGGFIGVDVFFVISGYLISTIIFENLDKGTFSFFEFYSRRIRRIFPALLLVLIACFAFGWFALLADEYKQLGKHIAGGASFISNFILWNEAGYFDNSAETKPLLHLWSLGIEEQFYIVWPLLLWFGWKRNFNLLAITVVVTVFTFVLNIKGVKHDMVATFYSPQTRFWELLSGSLLAWFVLFKKEFFASFNSKIGVWLIRTIYSNKQVNGVKRLSNVFSFVGLFLLVYGIWRINKELSFPGKWALVPVFGTVLIILAGSKAWVNRVILSNKIAVWFGLISFPLYLWHWPLLSFVGIIESEEPSQNIRIAVVVLSVVLAWLTYKLVERPLRFGKHSKAKVIVLIVIMAIVGCLGYETYESNGVSFRYATGDESLASKHQLQILLNYNYFGGRSESEFWSNGCFNLDKEFDFFKDNGCDGPFAKSDKKVVIIGDSHSAYLSQFLRPYLIKKGYNVYQYSTAFCTPFSLKDDRARCKNINEIVLERIKSIKPEVVLMFPNYILYTNSSNNHEVNPYEIFVANYANALIGNGVKDVLLIGQIPTWDDSLPHSLLRNYLTKGMTIPTYTKLGVNEQSLKMGEKLSQLKLNKSVHYISLKDFLCTDKGCRTLVGDDIKNDLIVYDYGHLTISGAKFVTNNLLYKYFPD